MTNTVSCDEPHDVGVFALKLVGSELGLNYPTSAMEEFAFFACLENFDAYVGRVYEDSILEITFLTPTSESWADGDRVITCALFRLDLQKMTGSMKESGR